MAELTLNAVCAWWLLAGGWLLIRGVLRRAEQWGTDQRGVDQRGFDQREVDQRASMVPRQDDAPHRHA